MLTLRLQPAARQRFERNIAIRDLEGYFSFQDSPARELLIRPELAQKAIELLDKIQDLTQKEYAFTHIQEGPLGAYCVPTPKDYCPKNLNVTNILGSYDKKYFQTFLEGRN